MPQAKGQRDDGRLVQVNPLRLAMDWRAYWKEFKQVHGEPVLSEGRLLFRDGWTYSSTDIKGPEWHPPLTREGVPDKDKLRTMQRTYWTIRQRVLAHELDMLERSITAWRELQSLRSAPVRMTMVVHEDQGDGSVKPRRLTCGMEAIKALEQGRVKDLRHALEECQTELGKLKESHDEDGQTIDDGRGNVPVPGRLQPAAQRRN